MKLVEFKSLGRERFSAIGAAVSVCVFVRLFVCLFVCLCVLFLKLITAFQNVCGHLKQLNSLRGVGRGNFDYYSPGY